VKKPLLYRRVAGQDGRLDRLLETTTMIMEALHGYEDKVNYSIVGHSGDSSSITLIPFGHPPTTPMQRLGKGH